MRTFLVASTMLVVACCSATAVPVSLDFSTFATQGESFENRTLGILTLSSESGDLHYTGSYGGGLITDESLGSTADVYLNFSAPVFSLTARGGDGGGDLDAFSIYLYEFGTSNFLGRFDSPVFGGPAEPEWYTLTVSVPNIGRAIFDPGNGGVLPGAFGSPYGGVAFTDINYDTAVPEPSTAALLAAPLLLLYVRLRSLRT